TPPNEKGAGRAQSRRRQCVDSQVRCNEAVLPPLHLPPQLVIWAPRRGLCPAPGQAGLQWSHAGCGARPCGGGAAER
ncbi:unnamed protein product, partial [Effrenium voratum]